MRTALVCLFPTESSGPIRAWLVVGSQCPLVQTRNVRLGHFLHDGEGRHSCSVLSMVGENGSLCAMAALMMEAKTG